MTDLSSDSPSSLRFGWTTGCCATAAACAAWQRFKVGENVRIVLPGGQTPTFVVALATHDDHGYQCGIIKDAGDDPDVTDGVLVTAHLRPNHALGLRFFAGQGVGTVTREGLPLAVGEPAINPKPRVMISDNLRRLASDAPLNFDVTIGIPGGEALAAKTWNPRLGIAGGLSILGTTGIVRPFSCSAWIHSIHRGIDVARANAWPVVLASTGSSSEAAAQKILGIGEECCIEMGDFAGATLKYLRKHPVPRFVLAGGFAKMSKLAQGAKSLHSKDSQVDFSLLARWAQKSGAEHTVVAQIAQANTAMAAVAICPALAHTAAAHIVANLVPTLPHTRLEVMIFDRQQQLLAHQQ